MYSWYLSVVMVFLSWQLLHRACQLLSSQKRFLSPLWGMIWSTTVASTSLSTLRHWAHKGLALRNFFLSTVHLLSYPLSLADSLSLSFCFLCFHSICFVLVQHNYDVYMESLVSWAFEITSLAVGIEKPSKKLIFLGI